MMRCRARQDFEHVYDELIQIIYSASLDPSRWQVFLDRVSQDCGDIPDHLFGHDHEAGTCLDILYAGYDPQLMDDFRNYYGAINTWAPGFFQLPVGVAHTIERMCPEDRLLKTEFYADWVQPQEDIRKGGGVMLYKDDTRMFALGANIRRREAGQLVEPWLELIEALTPHLKQSLEISRTMASLTFEKLALGVRGTSLSSGVVALDGQGRLVMANQSAQCMLEDGGVLRCNLSGAVTFTDATANHQLVQALRGLPRGGERVPTCFDVRVDAVRTLRCRGIDIMPGDHGVAPVTLGLGVTQRVLLLTLTDVGSDGIERVLRERFRLTPRECVVASGLWRGKSLQQIADEQARSVHTIRDQQKSAMAKLGVSRQAELVACLNRLNPGES